MRHTRVWLSKLAGVFDGGRAERALADELESHLALHIDDNLRAGMTPADARREALLKLGGRELVKEEYRDQRRPQLLSAILQDARFAFRTMRRSPGLTLVAILTLALGIGANTAMFSIVHGVLLQPLPYRDPARLAYAFSTSASRGFQNFGTSPPDFRELRDKNRTLTSLSAFYPDAFNLSGESHAERLLGQVVSTEFFETLGVAPMLGRSFSAGEGTWGTHRVVMLSETLWRNRFSARTDILGTHLRLNGKQYTVIGVMPSSFYFLSERQIWVPMAWRKGDSQDSHSNYFLNMVARLKPGVTIGQARTDLDSIMANIASTNPESKGVGASLMPLDEAAVGDVRRALWVLLAAVGFILLICCVNLSSLLLSRDSARKKEFALRAALGASRARLVSQFLTENVLLALLGGSAALALAYLAVAQARTLAVNVPRIEHVSVDTTVLIFAFVVSIGSGILSGLAPCLWGARPDLNDALQEGGRQQSASGGNGRLRSALIMVEVALAFVLTIGAGLMVQSFTRLVRVGLGVDPESVLTFSISLPDSYTTPSDPNELTTPPRQTAFYDEVVARITRLPGVSAVGVTSTLPLRGNNWTKYLSFDDRPAPLSLDKVAMVQFRATDGDYFRAMRITLRKGRFFEPADDNPQSVPVAIINSALAQRFFPNEDPIGKLIWPAPPESLLPPGAAPPGFRFPRVRIVGVVDDVHYGSLNESPVPELYAPLAQSDCLSTMFVAVQTRVPPNSLISSIRGEVAAIDRGQPIARIATMEDVVRSAVALPRLHTLVLGAFGALALGLAAVGLYGVIAQSVAQRRHEVGVRMALGARPQSIVAAIVRRAMGLVAIGLAAGCGLALALTHLMASLLFEVTATDPWTFAGAAALLIVTSILASYLPARRAASVDPMVALRCD